MPQPEPERLRSSPISCDRLGHDLISGPDERISHQRVTRWVALFTGVTFVVAGLVKFVFHHWELHAFRTIISSGVGHGDVIPSLTLAPALLLATLFLLVRGLGLGGSGEA
jgi:hypothetical protein